MLGEELLHLLQNAPFSQFLRCEHGAEHLRIPPSQEIAKTANSFLLRHRGGLCCSQMLVQVMIEENLAEQMVGQSRIAVLKEVDNASQRGWFLHYFEHLLQQGQKRRIRGISSVQRLDLWPSEVDVVVEGQPVPPEPHAPTKLLHAFPVLDCHHSVGIERVLPLLLLCCRPHPLGMPLTGEQFRDCLEQFDELFLGGGDQFR